MNYDLRPGKRQQFPGVLSPEIAAPIISGQGQGAGEGMKAVGISREEVWVLKGLLTGGITLGIAAVFPEPLVFTFLAVVLGLVLGVYPGMAMGNPGEGRPALQWGFALLVVAAALAGLWASPVFLTGAFLLHWIWSLLHQFTALGDGVPEGFPAFCVTFDLVLAGFSIFLWSTAA